jgi:hypothetical protein
MKALHLSKTVWFNIITFILLVLAMPEFISIIPSSWLGPIAFAAGIGNLMLRVFFTSQPTSLNLEN